MNRERQSAPEAEKEQPRPHAPENGGKPKRNAPAAVYLGILFVAAFLMLVLAYFIQVRNEEALAASPDTGAGYVLSVAEDPPELPWSGWDEAAP